MYNRTQPVTFPVVSNSTGNFPRSLVICLFPSLTPNEDHIIFHSAVVSLLLRTVVDILYKSNEFTVFPLSSDTPSLPDDSSEVKRNKSLEHLVTSELGIDLVLRQVPSS